jgi:hypothetical protein
MLAACKGNLSGFAGIVNLCLFFKIACGVRKTGLQTVFAFLDVGLKKKVL